MIASSYRQGSGQPEQSLPNSGLGRPRALIGKHPLRLVPPAVAFLTELINALLGKRTLAALDLELRPQFDELHLVSMELFCLVPLAIRRWAQSEHPVEL